MNKILLLTTIVFSFSLANISYASKRPKFIKKKVVEQPTLETVDQLDPYEYSGLWYEYARIPNSFQKNCVGNVTAIYQVLRDDCVSVKNTCLNNKGKYFTAEGNAIAKDETFAKLKVGFTKPWFTRFSSRADYWVLELADDYSYAVVGMPSRKALWILSRTKTMNENTYQDLLNRIELNHGYKASDLVKTQHGL